MSDLISRQAALDAISTFGNREYRRKQGTLQDAYKLISALPSARPKGKWMHQDHNKRHGMMTTLVYYMPTCSECGKTGDNQYHYCPHCGADMRGGDNETD